MMASLAGHDSAAHDARFLALLPLIEEGAHDERNFVIMKTCLTTQSLCRTIRQQAAQSSCSGGLAVAH